MTPAAQKHYAAVIKRLRELLCAQRDQFQLYLEVLHKQKNAIEQGKTEVVVAQVEREEQIMADILAVQKVIEPLSVLYQTIPVSRNPEAAEITEIKRALKTLQSKVSLYIEENKNLLSQRMTSAASELQAIKGSALRKQIAGRSTAGTPSYIDLEF